MNSNLLYKFSSTQKGNKKTIKKLLNNSKDTGNSSESPSYLHKSSTPYQSFNKSTHSQAQFNQSPKSFKEMITQAGNKSSLFRPELQNSQRRFPYIEHKKINSGFGLYAKTEGGTRPPSGNNKQLVFSKNSEIMLKLSADLEFSKHKKKSINETEIKSPRGVLKPLGKLKHFEETNPIIRRPNHKIFK